MKSVLCIMETAYRGTQEEQDDAALWVTQALAKGGGNFGVLLRGNAVNYSVTSQDANGVVIGGLPIARPLHPPRDLAALKAGGVPVYVVRDDLESRGIDASSVVGDVELVGSSDLAGLLSRYDNVWHW